ASVAEPRVPPEATPPRELELLAFPSVEHQTNVSFEDVAHVGANETDQLLETRASRQHALERIARERAEHQAKLVIALPDASAEHRRAPERARFARLPEAPEAAVRQIDPFADELFDADRQAKIVRDDRFQTVCVRPRRGEPRRVLQLGSIGDRVALLQSGERQTERRADVERKTALLAPILRRRRLGAAPRAVKQKQHAVMEKVDEAHERSVGRVA